MDAVDQGEIHNLRSVQKEHTSEGNVRALQHGTQNRNSEQVSKGAVAVAPRVYRDATLQMAALFPRVEAQRGVIIPSTIRFFLTNTVIESLYLDPDAWRRVCGADPTIEADAERISEQIHNSLLYVLSNSEAESLAPNGTPRITHTGVLRCIHDHWCGIFPFCRKPQPPPLSRDCS